MIGWIALGLIGLLLVVLAVSAFTDKSGGYKSVSYECEACKDGSDRHEQICSQCGRQLDPHMNT